MQMSAELHAYILIFNKLYRYVVAVNTAYVDTVIDYVSKDIIQYSYDVIDYICTFLFSIFDY